jgi:cyclophilin family peptidyl-prolyl cis-trans isomerase
MAIEEIAPTRWSEVSELREARLVVELESGKQFEAELLVDVAPLTAVRVARLARKGYYHTLTFHRVVPNFVVQGGGPAGNEYSGARDFMPDELSDVSHARGTIGISTRGRDTGDAQLFVNLRDNPRLDYDYTVFARITAGLDAVDGVQEGERIRRIVVRQAPRLGSADTAALMRTVRVLAADSMEGRRAGTPGGARARRYLLRRMASLGLTPWQGRFEHPFPLRRDSATGVNLLGVIPGKRRDLPYLVLSAHYDHEGIKNGQIYNGADDNASGVAAVLSIAAALRRHPLDHPVLVALFDAEEAGLLGARALVADSAFRRERVALDVNLDMVSHSEAGVLWAAGSAHHPELRPVLEAIAARAPVILKLGHDRRSVSGEQDWTGSSDHGPFHVANIPFVYFGVEDHQDYHKPTDDPGTVTVGFFGGAVATIEAALRALDALRLTP